MLHWLPDARTLFQLLILVIYSAKLALWSCCELGCALACCIRKVFGLVFPAHLIVWVEDLPSKWCTVVANAVDQDTWGGPITIIQVIVIYTDVYMPSLMLMVFSSWADKSSLVHEWLQMVQRYEWYKVADTSISTPCNKQDRFGAMFSLLEGQVFKLNNAPLYVLNIY